MMAPLITVVIPCHNGERYLEETLASVLHQTWRPIDVVVVNDGSTDNSAALAERLGDPIRVVSQSQRGPAAARNCGIATARGDLIAFIDQDDLWVPEKLTMQMAAFEADPALDVCVGYIQRFRDTAHGRVKRGKPVPGYLSVTLLAKRALFDLHLFDAARKYSDSADWFLHVQAAGYNIRLLPDLLTLHRDHADNLSLTHGDESRQEFLHLLKAKIDRERDPLSSADSSMKPASGRR